MGRKAIDAELGEQERSNTEIARLVYDLRKQARLSQRELAKRVETTQSVISRLEDADYNGHSLSMLRRLAEAADKRIEIRFVSKRRSSQKEESMSWCEACQKETLDDERDSGSLPGGRKERFRYCECGRQKKEYQSFGIVNDQEMEWCPILDGLPGVPGKVWRIREKGAPNSGYTITFTIEQENILRSWPGWTSEESRDALMNALSRYLGDPTRQKRSPGAPDLNVNASDF